MSKSKKTTAIYSNPDEAPITYANETEVTTKAAEVESKAEVVADDSSVIVESSETTEEPVQNEESTVKESKVESEKPVLKSAEINDNTEIPETAFTNYVRVRIAGRSKYSGYHMMSPVTIANMVVTNDANDYMVIVSQQTSALVCKIIRYYSSKLCVNLPIERREIFITRFLNANKKFKL